VQEAVTLCLCREGPRGGIVVLVYGLLNLAAPYLMFLGCKTSVPSMARASFGSDMPHSLLEKKRWM